MSLQDHKKIIVSIIVILLANTVCFSQQNPETLQQITSRLGAESTAAYKACRFSALSKDYFARFSRDPQAQPIAANEVMPDTGWKIVLSSEATPLAELMAKDLAEFLERCMNLKMAVEKLSSQQLQAGVNKAIVLAESGGGAEGTPESFTISVKAENVTVRGSDSAGLRDGVVKLVELLGMRQAPILRAGEQVYKPRLAVRLGAVPFMGSYRDLVFMGYNAVFISSGSLYGLSQSDAIAELAGRRQQGSPAAMAKALEEAKRYGLRTYSFIDIRQKFPKDDPVFAAHPEIRGALTWSADGEYVLCTEHPLVRRFLCESVAGLFKAAPRLDGIVIIIGGEGFYHCFMRSYGTEKGHTNCPRCEKLGAETVVANLCNYLAEAARKVNPKAEVVAWPYSAEHVWSADKAQAGLISKLKPGVAIFTEIEKDEYVQKPDGVNKHLWDYSIDLIGPGERAKKQIEACRAAGIPIYIKSEPELAFEAPQLPQVPCMDRWADRAEALASCGANGAWVFPAFRPCYGTSTVEVYKLFWWEPVREKETILQKFAERIAGRQVGAHLRNAWKYVSEAIAWSPELPVYYTGPYYLGPAHPMCADKQAELPEVFYGRYLYLAEMQDSEGLKLRPTFVTSPTGNVPVFGKFYRRMEELLKLAADEVDKAEPMVEERHRLMLAAEASAIRWFYHTARTEANFYESCQLRDQLLSFSEKDSKNPDEVEKMRRMYQRWREVLLDEKANAIEALPVVEADMRLDFYYGGDHTFPHAADMIRAKLKILDNEIDNYLPSLAARSGIDFKEQRQAGPSEK